MAHCPSRVVQIAEEPALPTMKHANQHNIATQPVQIYTLTAFPHSAQPPVTSPRRLVARDRKSAANLILALMAFARAPSLLMPPLSTRRVAASKLSRLVKEGGSSRVGKSEVEEKE